MCLSGVRIIWCGPSVALGEEVRRLSWRVTTSSSACLEGVGVQVAGETERRGDVVGGAGAFELVEEPQALLGEGQRQRPGRRLRRRAGVGWWWPGRVWWRESAMVGVSKSVRGSAARCRGRPRTRLIRRVARREWPPSSKKLSSMPTLGDGRGLRRRVRRAISSAGCAGRAPTAVGAGSRVRGGPCGRPCRWGSAAGRRG